MYAPHATTALAFSTEYPDPLQHKEGLEVLIASKASMMSSALNSASMTN